MPLVPMLFVVIYQGLMTCELRVVCPPVACYRGNIDTTLVYAQTGIVH